MPLNDKPHNSNPRWWALILTAPLFLLPVLGHSDIPAPFGLGLLALLVLGGRLLLEPEVLAWLAMVAVWTIALAAVWSFFFRSGVWLRGLLIPAAVALTLGPWYWWDPLAPLSPEQIAELRHPESGDWEEVCRLEGFYPAPTSSNRARTAGRLWLQPHAAMLRSERQGYYWWDPASCNAPQLSTVPASATLWDGGPAGEALRSDDRGLFFDDGKSGVLFHLTEAKVASAVFSDDGPWAAWATPPSLGPKTIEVRRLTDGGETRVIPVASPTTIGRVKLLDYDAAGGEATLFFDESRLGRLDLDGHWVLEPFRPSGCGELAGAYSVRPSGWLFYGGSGHDCELRWRVRGAEGSYRAADDVDTVRWRAMAAEEADLHPGGKLAAVVVARRTHFFAEPEAFVVLRLEDGRQIFRRQLPQPLGGEALALFVGDGLLVTASLGVIHAYRIPAAAR